MIKTIFLFIFTLIKCYAMDLVISGDERRECVNRTLNTAFQAAKYEKHIFNKSRLPASESAPINFEQSLDFIDLMLEEIELEGRLWNTSILGDEWKEQKSGWQNILLKTRDDICLSKEKNPHRDNFIISVRSVWKAYNRYKSASMEQCTYEKNRLKEIADESVAAKLRLTYIREYIEFRYVYDTQMKREGALSVKELETLSIRHEMIEKYINQAHKKEKPRGLLVQKNSLTSMP